MSGPNTVEVRSRLAQMRAGRHSNVERHEIAPPSEVRVTEDVIGVIDFFSGCGGTSAGLRRAGMKILAGIDMDEEAAETFQHNFKEAGFISRDVRDVTVEDLAAFISPHNGNTLLFSACAPCQPFSKQNRERGLSDTRSVLLDELHRFISYYLPDYIFLENVPGIQKIVSGDGPLKSFLLLLDKLGYAYKMDVIDFRRYGVPQTRRRFVLLASRSGSITFPNYTHGDEPNLPAFSNVWDWIGTLPPLAAGGSDPSVLNHVALTLSPLNQKRIESTPEGGDRRDWPDDLLLNCHRDHKGHTDVYGRLRRYEPACTLTTRCISLSNGRFGHPTQNRALSVREAACLQTFSPDFEFKGTLNSMATQIGNAVPELLSFRFGEHVLKHRVSSVEGEAS